MRRLALVIAALATAALLATGALPAPASADSRGDVSVLALIPTPGYPALPRRAGRHCARSGTVLG